MRGKSNHVEINKAKVRIKFFFFEQYPISCSTMVREDGSRKSNLRIRANNIIGLTSFPAMLVVCPHEANFGILGGNKSRSS